MQNRRLRGQLRRAWPVLGIVVVSTVLFAPSLFMGQVLWTDDNGSCFYPWQVYIAEQRQAGNWLPWCDDIGCGFPLWANMQCGAFYPLNLLFLLPLPMTWTFGFLAALHHALAATGMYLLARRLGLARLPAFVACVLYAFTGYVGAHGLQTSILYIAAWMPWVALGTLGWVQDRSKGWLAVAMAGCAAHCMGHPQQLMLTLTFTLACVAVVVGLARPSSWRSYASSLGLALVPLLPGLMIAAVQIWPFVELLRAHCGDHRKGYEFMTSYSLPPWHLVTLIFPNFFGRQWPEPYWGKPNYWELCGYCGGVALLLALLTPTRDERLGRVRKGLLILSGVALLLAFGGYTPLYRALQYVPGLNRFRVPARWVCVWGTSICLLAAIAVQQLPRYLGDGRASRRLARLLGALALVSGGLWAELTLLRDVNVTQGQRLLGLILHYSGKTKSLEEYAPRIPELYDNMVVKGLAADAAWFALYAGAAALALAMVARRRWSPERAATALAVIVLLQAMQFAWVYAPPAPETCFDWPQPVMEAAAHPITDGRLAVWDVPWWPFTNVLADINLLHHVPMVDIYDALRPPVQVLQERIAGRILSPTVAAALGTSTLVTRVPPDRALTGLSLMGSFADSFDGSSVYVYRNDRFRGLAWTVTETTSEPDARRALADPEGDLEFLLDAPFLAPSESWQPKGPSPQSARDVSVAEWTPERKRIRVTPGEPCGLVVTSAALPGWRVTINDGPAETAVANGVFWCVSLPAGACEVQMMYSRDILRASPYVTLAGLLLAIALLCWPYRRRS